MKIPFVGQAYTMPSRDLDAQNCINWFLVKDPTGKFPVSLSPSPGHNLFSPQVGTQYSVRVMFSFNNKGYAVVDNKLYQIFTSGERKELGTLNTSVGRLTIIANENQLGIFDRFYGYVYQVLKTDDYDAGDFDIIDKTSSVIADPTFTGSGLDDLTTEGAYTGNNNKTYRVEIQTAGTPDKFRWSDTDGTTWNVENIDIIEGVITLNDGVQIEFNNTTGHTANDYWKFAVTTDDTFYPPLIPTVVDGYGMFPRQNTPIFYATAIDDFRTINALDFATAIGKPNNLIASMSIRSELWLFTTRTIETWYNTGSSDFPFEPRSNFLKNSGCAAPYSLVKVGENILLWLSENNDGERQFLLTSNYQDLPISTEALDSELATYDVVEDAFAVPYFYQGQSFIAWTFPTEDKTWVYSLTTKSWHERLSRRLNVDPKNKEYKMGRWSANCYMFFDGKNLIGDYETGNIYEMTRDSYMESNGLPMVLERTIQHIQDDLNRLFFDWLMVDFEAGVGLVNDTAQGHNPEIMLLISKDGGHSWVEREWKSVGKIGKRRQRAKWNKLGYARVWTFRIRISDPVYRVLLGAVGEAEGSEE